MKTKYLLRGIGIGIVIATIIMYAAMATLGTNKTGDADKKDVASGKEVTTEKVAETTEATTEKTTEAKTEATTEKTTEKTTEATTEKTTEKTTEATTEKTTEKATEVTTEKTTEKATEATTEKASGDGSEKSITITSGMGSEEISALLEKEGLVKSASEYNAWLIEKGHDSNLHVGTFKIKSGATFEEIAKILTTQGQ